MKKKKKVKKVSNKAITKMTSVNQACLDIHLPKGYEITSYDNYVGIVKENGKTTIVAPFGCIIKNETDLPSNFGDIAVFNPFGYPALVGYNGKKTSIT